VSPYEWFEHTADLGLRVAARDLGGLFRDAGEGLFATIVERFPDDDSAERLDFRIEGRRLDWLLFDWLNELLYVFESRRLILGRFEVEVDGDGLSATAWAHPFDPRRQRATHEVKAITYHRLRVERVDEGGWIAEFVVDI
jgi:SHS2 domain-containing protein